MVPRISLRRRVRLSVTTFLSMNFIKLTPLALCLMQTNNTAHHPTILFSFANTTTPPAMTTYFSYSNLVNSSPVRSSVLLPVCPWSPIRLCTSVKGLVLWFHLLLLTGWLIPTSAIFLLSQNYIDSTGDDMKEAIRVNQWYGWVTHLRDAYKRRPNSIQSFRTRSILSKSTLFPWGKNHYAHHFIAHAGSIVLPDIENLLAAQFPSNSLQLTPSRRKEKSSSL